ncbi:hypothetical protein [Paenibacillus sp. NPDC058071]|uniref:hypothetical protein n=1 Tax=Paenibacillus sp. NPDC058071 TaxID=3346326 RepID=UPI0036D92E4E
MTPQTIHAWVREFQDTLGEDTLPTLSERAAEEKRYQELEEKHARVLKAFGEKELELEILRELLKKKSPLSMTNSRLLKPSSSEDTRQ